MFNNIVDKIKFGFKYIIAHRNSWYIFSIAIDIFVLFLFSISYIYTNFSCYIFYLVIFCPFVNLISSFSRFFVFMEICYHSIKGGDSLSEYIKRNT